ncbi:unnamed protein product [Candidula unifasciata]|uniref:Uncharacterized protein n=1 Tax=Candidula unifasciata TaxID=100452 RepID=A0A8S4A8R1_9EUPU|nr:unnamed protein product [Candidula unifasciata]
MHEETCTMSTVIKWNKKWLFFVGIALGFVLFNCVYHTRIGKFSVITPEKSKYSVWPQFESKSPINNIFFRSECVKAANYSLTGLSDIKTQWARAQHPLCQKYYNKFTSIFTLKTRKATLSIPEGFRSKVRGWLANNEDLYQEIFVQDIIHIISEFTREHTVFNPLRDKRPIQPPDQSQSEYFDELLKATAKTCDFCNFTHFTAEHTFGRVQSKHAFTASNIFKIDTLHAVVAMKQHDPLHWSLEEFVDLFRLTETWIKKANSHYPQARYPALIWDILPKCGASQVHPHLQLVLDFERYHGEIEAWRRGAQEYYSLHNSNYFTDLVAVYSALNLTVTYGSAVAFASLVPKRDHEMVIMAREPSTDFYTLLFAVLRAFIDDFHKMCYSMGMAYPAVDTPEGKLPIYARVITRGFVTDIRSDISSFEMFLATNVNIDPYKTIDVVRSSVNQRLKNMNL